jgi:ATP-dependent Clp protease ATP-binding subunit ClpA
MAGLKPGLKALLKQLKVRVDKPDDDTMLLRNVPVDLRSFSKPRTNVLVKRPRAGLPFLMCVDEDLDYIGHDREMARVFAAADRVQGWRVVSAGAAVYHQAEDAVQRALAMLGASGDAPVPGIAPARPAGSGLLAQFAVNITAQITAEIRDGSAPCTVGREEAAEQTATSLLSWQRRLPIVVGAPGLGKTNLLYKVAAHLAEVRPDWELLSVDLSCLLAGVLWEGERERLLNAALQEAVAGGPAVLVLERLELAVMTVPMTPWLLTGALDCGARLAATCLPAFVEKLVRGPLARRMDPIEVIELAREDAAAVLLQLRETLAAIIGWRLTRRWSRRQWRVL